jgi:hypothetical protein
MGERQRIIIVPLKGIARIVSMQVNLNGFGLVEWDKEVLYHGLKFELLTSLKGIGAIYTQKAHEPVRLENNTSEHTIIEQDKIITAMEQLINDQQQKLHELQMRLNQYEKDD